MSPAQPDGQPAPASGALPPGAGSQAREREFGVYLHVPFCVTRCGYCDFNTYTLTEVVQLPSESEPGGAIGQYLRAARAEIDLAARVMDEAGVDRRPAATVFFGGGTPTLVQARELIGLLNAVRQTWGIADDAEITAEANPDMVSAESLQELAAGGFTRISFGMQSVVSQVLQTLDRTHTPGQVERAHTWAREAGLATSLDLIYGTPGESVAAWVGSVEAAIMLAPDHISAYALTIEPGTAMGRQLARGEIAPVDSDDQATKYEIADTLLAAAGYDWYEISNWACPGAECRHNLAYWRSQDWWGIGPGAHSYLGGRTPVRWWNVKHPRTYAAALAAGNSPAAAREILDPEARYLEEVMLRSRLAEGLPIESLRAEGKAAVAGLIADGLVYGRHAVPTGGGRLVLTRRGRLLADTVVARLIP